MGHETDIVDFVFSNVRRAAPNITHALSVIGDGKMMDGIRSIVRYATGAGIEYGKKEGMRNGIIIGAGLTLLLRFCYDTIQKNQTEKFEREQAIAEADRQVQTIDTKTGIAQDGEGTLHGKNIEKQNNEEEEI